MSKIFPAVSSVTTRADTNRPWKDGGIKVSASTGWSKMTCMYVIILSITCLPWVILAVLCAVPCTPFIAGIIVLYPMKREGHKKDPAADSTEADTNEADKPAHVSIIASKQHISDSEDQSLGEATVSIQPTHEPDGPNVNKEVRCFLLDGAQDRPLFQTAVTDFIHLVDCVVQGTKLRLLSLTAELVKEDVSSGDAQTPIIVPCLAVSRVASCIESVMNKLNIPATHGRLLVVFHPRAAHDQRVPSTRGQLGSQMRPDIERIVDVVFNRATGKIYDNDENRQSVAQLANDLIAVQL